VRVNPSVPEVVIGEPDTDRPVGTVMATEVTVPLPQSLPVPDNNPVVLTWRHWVEPVRDENWTVEDAKK
jgi:hypothetical protein